MSDQYRDCIARDRTPRTPGITLPKGAVDTHVFENRSALSPARGYTLPVSTLADLRHLHATLGFERVVFTRPSPEGTDNQAISDGAAGLNAETANRARMVVAVAADVTEDGIAGLHKLGARGVAERVRRSVWNGSIP